MPYSKRAARCIAEAGFFDFQEVLKLPEKSSSEWIREWIPDCREWIPETAGEKANKNSTTTAYIWLCNSILPDFGLEGLKINLQHRGRLGLVAPAGCHRALNCLLFHIAHSDGR